MASEETKQLWQIVGRKEFAVPRGNVGEAASSAIGMLWEKLFGAEELSREVDVQAELRNVPQALLDWVAPYPSWQAASKSLYSHLKDWLKSDSKKDLLRVFVSPPGGGMKEIVERLAEDQGWPVINYPSFEQTILGNFSWLDRVPKSNEAPLVIPVLGNVFIRHYNGFEVLRRMVDMLFHSNQKCIIVCNSWLWRFLQGSMGIDSLFPEPEMFQALSAENLEKWFCELEKANGKSTTMFRQSDNGRFVLPVSETADEEVEEELLEDVEEGPADFLNRLAAESRGSPLVAWAIWRHSLNLAPDEDVEDAARDAAILDKGRTIWVKPFAKLVFPHLASDERQETCFILQSLLIHQGLSSDMLLELLKIDRDVLLSILASLKNSGLILEERGLWRVAWLGYPAVRKFLSQQDYLLDLL